MPKLAIIDLTPEDNQAQVAIRHPDGQVIVLTARAYRSTVTLYVPGPVQLKGTGDPGEMMLSWMMLGEARDGSEVKH